jgi:Ca2+/Na+ antiporter
MDFLEKKSPLLLKISLSIHTLLFLTFTIIFVLIKEQFDIYYKIYVISVLLLSVVYMIYFAHHSVNK